MAPDATFARGKEENQKNNPDTDGHEQNWLQAACPGRTSRFQFYLLQRIPVSHQPFHVGDLAGSDKRVKRSAVADSALRLLFS